MTDVDAGTRSLEHQIRNLEAMLAEAEAESARLVRLGMEIKAENANLRDKLAAAEQVATECAETAVVANRLREEANVKLADVEAELAEWRAASVAQPDDPATHPPDCLGDCCVTLRDGCLVSRRDGRAIVIADEVLGP